MIYKSNLVRYRIIKEPTNTLRSKFTSSNQVAEYFRQNIFHPGTIGVSESFWILTLNQQNAVVGMAKISDGGITGTVVDPILVAKYAIETLAKSIIMAHNHPSGQLNPSQQDLFITDKIKNGLALFDIRVLDHLIITEDKFFSFADEGKL